MNELICELPSAFARWALALDDRQTLLPTATPDNDSLGSAPHRHLFAYCVIELDVGYQIL